MITKTKLRLQALIMCLGLDFRRSFESAICDKMLRLEHIVDRRLDSYLNKIALTSVQDKVEIDKLIVRVRERRLNLHIKPEFTPEVVGVCKHILAFGAAGLGLAVAFSDNLDVVTDGWRRALIFVSLFYFNLTITSLLVLILFFIQARSRYPFLFLHHLGNRWPFFYYATLTPTQSWRPLLSPWGIYRSNITYMHDLIKMTKNVIAEDKEPRMELKNEILQYFLLLRYQGYLDQYELQLVNTFMYMSSGSLLAAIVITMIV
jgi:hypothetical protein